MLGALLTSSPPPRFELLHELHDDVEARRGRRLLERSGERQVDRLELLSGSVYERLTLWVLADNLNAQGFYAHHGFRHDGTVKWVDELACDELRYVRPL